MTATFASADWAARLATSLQESARVRTESMSWVFGPLLLIVDADAEHGFESTGLLLDLHEGSCRAVTSTPATAAPLTPFSISGSLATWKTVADGGLDVVDAILDSKLRGRGDLPTLARHRALLAAVAAAAGELETTWPQEQEPVAASAG
jgi:hypothetical protein